jgi:hypothetical protein
VRQEKEKHKKHKGDKHKSEKKKTRRRETSSDSGREDGTDASSIDSATGGGHKHANRRVRPGDSSDAEADEERRSKKVGCAVLLAAVPPWCFGVIMSWCCACRQGRRTGTDTVETCPSRMLQSCRMLLIEAYLLFRHMQSAKLPRTLEGIMHSQ